MKDDTSLNMIHLYAGSSCTNEVLIPRRGEETKKKIQLKIDEDKQMGIVIMMGYS